MLLTRRAALGATAATALSPLWAFGPARAQPADTIRIGVLTDLSGPYRDVTGPTSVACVRQAVEEFSAQNPEIKIEIIAADHQNKPDVGINTVRQWFDQRGVDVVTDVGNSAIALGINPVCVEKDRVHMNASAGTSELTAKSCTPNTIHWTYDTWALANGTGKAIVKTGGDTWFFLTADYAFGHALERDTSAVVEKNGGKVVGRVRHPFPGTDFSSFLLQAQSSKAKIIGLANAGSDTINSIKQASEFGITRSGQNLAALLAFITDVHALGLATAQGLIMTEAWYWDLNDANREFAKKFAPQFKGVHPTMVHAGVYSAVTHYLKAVEALKSDADGKAVVAKMKEMPTDDKLFGKGTVRADGRKIHPMYLFEVKTPAESKGPWDYYKVRATIPAEEAFRPLADGGCPLVKS